MLSDWEYSIFFTILSPQGLWKCIFENFFLNYLFCSINLLIFALDSVSPHGQEGSRHIGKRTFTNVILRVSNLANLNLHLRKRNWNVRVGCIVSYYNNSRRGLTRVAYLDEGAMREPETWDKREVVTPTSFIYNLKQKPKLGRTIGKILLWLKMINNGVLRHQVFWLFC